LGDVAAEGIVEEGIEEGGIVALELVDVADVGVDGIVGIEG
jgi:hypothetical protein